MIRQQWRVAAFWLLCGELKMGSVDGFVPILSGVNPSRINFARQAQSTAGEEKVVKVGSLLSYLPTPSLLVELSLMEKYLQENNIDCSLEDFLADPKQSISSLEEDKLCDCGAFFIHTQVTSTEKRDAVTLKEGSGKSLSVCDVDTPPACVAPAGAYLGLGLANHHVGGYYWARSMGIGASLPAHGVYFGPSSSSSKACGELFWKKRGPGDPAETTEESSNSNDGKRSEWADFLKVGDTVQLVPEDPLSMLVCGDSEPQQQTFTKLLGLRRAGRPLGADPIVEQIWTRSDGTGGKEWTL